MLKGNHAASPVLGCFPSDGAFGEVLRQLFSGKRMIIELPFRNVDRHSDGEKNVQVPICRPNATFQWPADCLWPFMDYGPEKNV